jgi:ADP-ribosylglycohydrolase
MVGCLLGGYVVESAPLALYAAQRGARVGFVGALRELVSAGGDADANASIAGQVWGARSGLGGVPRWMLRRLPNLAECERIARQFAETVAASRGVRE